MSQQAYYFSRPSLPTSAVPQNAIEISGETIQEYATVIVSKISMIFQRTMIEEQPLGQYYLSSHCQRLSIIMHVLRTCSCGVTFLPIAQFHNLRQLYIFYFSLEEFYGVSGIHKKGKQKTCSKKYICQNKKEYYVRDMVKIILYISEQ